MKFLNKITLVIAFLALSFSGAMAQLVNLSQDAVVTASPSATIYIDGTLNLSSSSTFTQNGAGSIFITGDWTNNGCIFSPGSGTVSFNGTENASIEGTSSTTFSHITVDKSNNPTDILSLDIDAKLKDDLLVQDGIFRYNDVSSTTLTVGGDISVLSGNTFDVNSSGTLTHYLNVSGDILNNSTFDLRLGNNLAYTTFQGSGNSLLHGTGSTFEFHEIEVSKDNAEDEVHVNSSTFTTIDQFLTLTKGIFHLGGNFNITNKFFKYYTAPQIPAHTGLWIDNANAAVEGQNGNLEMRGLLRLSDGTVNIGDLGETTTDLVYRSDTGYKPELSIRGGTMNVNRRFGPVNGTSASDFEQSGGQFNIGVTGYFTNSNYGIFDLRNSSSMTWTAGTIELRRTNRSTSFSGGDYYVGTTSGTVTGGLLRIDAQESDERLYEVNSQMPVGEFYMTGTNDPVAKVLNNDFEVLDNITFAGTGSGRLDANDLDIYIGGDWINNTSTTYTGFTAGSGTVVFNGDSDQYIKGQQTTTFNNLKLRNKTGGDVILDVDTEETLIEGILSLLPYNSNTAILDLNQNLLVIGENGDIISDFGNTADDFDNTKYIKNSESSPGSNEYGGVLRREITSGTTDRTKLLYPVGDDTLYTPAEITFRQNQAAFGTNAYNSIQLIPKEHPGVDLSDASLKLYWKVQTNDITLDSDPNGDVDVVFYYDSYYVYGNESEYDVLLFSPPDPDPLGQWYIDPGGGGNDIVDFNNKVFYSTHVDGQLVGDWLAGEEDVAQVTYYSRKTGDYSDPATWSKINFNGPASSNAPNRGSDLVRIKDSTVTISDTISATRLLQVEGTGTLIINGDYAVTGDTFRLEDNTTFKIGHKEGCWAAPTAQGCVQTDVRELSNDVYYYYIDTSTPHQQSGDGLPSPLRTIIVDKSTSTDTVELDKHYAIDDSLVINNGSLDIGTYSINGNSSSRTFTMRDGELIVRSQYPTNYLDNTFNAGSITFDGTGNSTIPSSNSTPGVNQYHNLKISGERAANITFANQGNINISNSFSLSSLTFTGSPSQRFQTDGSTVVFKKDGGIQNIPCRPAAPSDTIFHLQYFNITIEGTGTKQLYSHTGAPLFIAQNDFNFNSSNFNSNGYNFEVQGDWINSGGIFNPGNDAVILRSPDLTFTNYVTSRDTSENPFNDLTIAGEGIVEPTDNTLVRGDLRIDTDANLSLAAIEFTLQGDWINEGNTLDYGTSTVYMTGTSQQNMSKTSGNEEFYDLIINNSSHVDASNVGSTADNAVIIHDLIELTDGNLQNRGRNAIVYGNISRPGANPGHIDGQLSKIVDTATVSVIYEVGYRDSYTPMTLELNGTGGVSDLVAVISDTVTAASSPVSTGISPAGSRMSDPGQVRRQWTISKPAGSNFNLGLNRQYDAIATFINAAAPNGDLRNGADPDYFEARLWNGSWILPDRFGDPSIGARNSNSTEYGDLEQFGTIIVGEPDHYSYFSIANGNWSNPGSWSTQGYGGDPSTTVPTDDAYVYIGDSYSISLDNNPTTANGVVTLDSSGTLLCGTNVLSGASGTFIKTNESTLGIGSSDGIRATGSAGNIQTLVREYNYNNHNRGHFIYTGNQNQTQADNGLPLTIATLTVDKSANSVSVNRNGLTITDSLHLESGTYAAGAALNLEGNLYRNSGADFSPGANTVNIIGDETQFFTNNATTSAITFNNLNINKSSGDGILTLNDTSPISISNMLIFANGNDAVIDALGHTNNYVEIPSGGNLIRNGQGHIYGQLRKYIGSGDQPTITFEVGDTTHYTPYQINFDGGGGTSGIFGVSNIPEAHPRKNDVSCPIDPARYIPRYWRVTLPPGSSFDRGSRDMTVTLTFIDPDDIQTIDHPTCLEMAFWKGPALDWQALRPNTTTGNFAYSCSDTRFITGHIDYDGSMTTVRANDIPSDSSFGDDYVLSDSSVLLGDFFAGNQNSGRTTIFYSIANGDWTDTDTWSTQGYSSTVTASSYPRTQYDVAYIGNNKRVALNENIGTNYLYSGNANAYFGPAVNVESSGNLALGKHVLRGVAFTAEKGSYIEVGSEDGITPAPTGRGNVISWARTYKDSMNIIYTAEGYTPVVGGTWMQYCDPRSWNASYRYTERVRVQDDTPTTIMDNISADSLREDGYFYFAWKSAVMNAGDSYRLVLTPDDNNTRRWRVWIDFNYDGDFYDTGEMVVDEINNGELTTDYFTVPAGTNPGVTRMRVSDRSGTNAEGPCSRNETGEVEDYTIEIMNSSPVITQSTGSGLPENLWSIQMNSPRSNGSRTNLGKEINVRDSVKIISGFFDANGNDINLAGDFINDTTNGFDHGNAEVRFYGDQPDTIRGKETVTFNDVRIDKDTNNVYLSLAESMTNYEAKVEGTFNFQTENLLVLDNSTTLTLENNASLAQGGSGFGQNRMIQVSGESDAGWLNKEFSTASGQKSFFFPVGVDTVYNPADISLTGSYTGTPALSLQLHKGIHPQAPGSNLLKKYWRVQTQDISNISANSFDLTYEDVDTTGDVNEYIPAVYQLTGGWEINVGQSPKAYPSPIEVNNSPVFLGDWTAGEARSFFDGRIFYSINTGVWDVSSNWSNESHTGPPSSYFPGQIFDEDTVYVDGYEITYNKDSIQADLLRIGGTFGTNGQLTFGSAPQNKTLALHYPLSVMNDGIIDGTTGGSRKDTLILEDDLYNYSQSADGGYIDFVSGTNDYTVLKMTGSSTLTTIDGEGVWRGIQRVELNKDGGLSDTLDISSQTFAAATAASPASYIFKPEKGVTRLSVDENMYISGGNNELFMGTYTGFDIRTGMISSSSTLTTNVNTTLNLDGGDMTIGDETDENLYYKTGTKININDGKLDIAGCFTRFVDISNVNFEMEANGTTQVLTEGNNNTALIGFDITNTTSSFTMNGGEIIIANGTPGAAADYRGSAVNGAGMNGGEIQTGTGGAVTQSGAVIKIAGMMPVWNLHAAGNGIDTVKSQITQETFTIDNDWIIDDLNIMELRGNTVNLAGSLDNYGVFDPISGSSPTDPRLLVLTGSSNTQTLYNDNAGGLELYNLRLDKNGGRVLLGKSSGDNSNLIVRNTLEFSANNASLLDARTNALNVEMSPSGGSNPQILRNGLGHIDGRLYRTVGTGNKNVFFAVGSSTITEYRPAAFETVGNDGTEGLVGVVNYGFDHPVIDSARVKTESNVQSYWNISNTGGFDLGTRTFSLTTYYLNPEDIRDLQEDTLNFEHHLYQPPCPDPPAACPDTGTWTMLYTPVKRGNYVKSTYNRDFGDVIVAIPLGIPFYSINDGDWDNPGNWSTVSYGSTLNELGRYPGEDEHINDQAFIGNGKQIYVPDGLSPRILLTQVEKYNGLPGELYIEGNIGSIRGNSFVLKDSCILGVMHLNGINQAGVPGGAVLTDFRNFGVSIYVYNTIHGSQNTGEALPDSIAALVVNNPSAPTNNVFISNPVGASDLKVRDSVSIIQGSLKPGYRSVQLYQDLFIKNNGVYLDTAASFSLVGPSSHTFLMGNTEGLDFYNFNINDGQNLKVDTLTGVGEYSHIQVRNELFFENQSVIDVRNSGRKVIVHTGGTVTQNTPDQGYVDGALAKPISAGDVTVKFEIGNGSATYTPATMIFENSVGDESAGLVEAINLFPLPDVPGNNQNSGHRLDPDKALNRYWRVAPFPDSGFAVGSRVVNGLFEFPPSEIDFNTNLAVMRRRSIPTENPEWTQREYGELGFDLGIASVRLTDPTEKWEGIGEFYLGEVWPRTFYSRNSGSWTDHNSWSFESHSGTICPSGAYPNNYEYEQSDNVEIGGSSGGFFHIIDLDMPQPELDTLFLQGDSELDMRTNKMHCFECDLDPKGIFGFYGNAVLSFDSTLNADENETITNFTVYDYSPALSSNTTIRLYGTQTIIPDPFGYPQYFGNLRTDLPGTKKVLTPIEVNGNFMNTRESTLEINLNVDAFAIRKNVINSNATIKNSGVIEIGED